MNHNCAVTADLARYESEIDAYEARQDAIDATVQQLTAQYWDEYMATGYVDELGLDTDELEFMALQRSVGSLRAILECEVQIMVDAAPDKYINPNYVPPVRMHETLMWLERHNRGLK